MISYKNFSWVWKSDNYRWQHKDGSWWTNVRGEIVPWNPQIHPNHQIHPKNDGLRRHHELNHAFGWVVEDTAEEADKLRARIKSLVASCGGDADKLSPEAREELVQTENRLADVSEDSRRLMEEVLAHARKMDPDSGEMYPSQESVDIDLLLRYIGEAGIRDGKAAHQRSKKTA